MVELTSEAYAKHFYFILIKFDHFLGTILYLIAFLLNTFTKSSNLKYPAKISKMYYLTKITISYYQPTDHRSVTLIFKFFVFFFIIIFVYFCLVSCLSHRENKNKCNTLASQYIICNHALQAHASPFPLTAWCLLFKMT